MLMDSGSSISLLSQDIAKRLKDFTQRPLPLIKLKTASGEILPLCNHISTQVYIQTMVTPVEHNFVVADHLIAPVILGTDFLRQHGLILDFSNETVGVYPKQVHAPQQELRSFWEDTVKHKPHIGAVAMLDATAVEATEECAIPDYGAVKNFELPQCTKSAFSSVINQYKHLFCNIPGKTTQAYHHIPTKGQPIRVPPRRVPAHYRGEVERQINEMLEQGIITQSSSPWMAPAVFVPKKSGDLRICIDYRELNKQTTKDAYPLPLPDEVQDRLAGSTIFSTLDLHSGYWQLPVNHEDQKKTAFCPGPGMGLYQFRQMPFGLTGAPSSFQRLMDSVFQGLPFVTTYIDDVLIHSSSEKQHKEHLESVFQRLTNAGLTLRGTKCQIGMSQVCYLGHVFTGKGMQPDPKKVSSVQDWPTPTDVTTLRQFIGLASYYRRYIKKFADIAYPLHKLTQKNAPFVWTEECAAAFTALKCKLIQAPILGYPQFTTSGSPFVLQTDASAVGLGAVLEQDNKVIAYASRALSKSECNYSTIQKECLGVVFATKQFRHYLLGRQFTVMTDHEPLQWLSAQKMEGLLCRWALALQEYTFKMVHRKGTLNGNADALSRRPYPITTPLPVAVTSITESTTALQQAQLEDPILRRLQQALSHSQEKPDSSSRDHPSFRRYLKLWHQLSNVDGIICRMYKPGPTSGFVTVPVIPTKLQQEALHQSHDQPSAGHQGTAKTLARLQQEAYWVGMAKDVQRYCQQCTTCQQAKLPNPNRAPMCNIPIGKPWEMLAADILEVPVSRQNHRYLLVVMDYFTKWVEAIPLHDQTAASITEAIIKICSSFGVPSILHSDQGRNFESDMLHQMLQAFGIKKSRTTAYHPQCDGMVERFNRSLLQLLRCYVNTEEDWETYLPLVLYAYRTAPHSTTGISPFQLMFGRDPKPATFPPTNAFDPSSYSAYLLTKLAKLQDLVANNITAAAQQQKNHYNKNSVSRTFSVGEPIWLSIPTARKLQPRWEGKWTVEEIMGPVNLKITDGKRTKVVHMNRVQHRVQPQGVTEEVPLETSRAPEWCPPQIDHLEVPCSMESERRYPQRNRRPPDWLRP